MTHSNEFPKFYNRYKTFQIYDLKPMKNKLFYLIVERKIMSIKEKSTFKTYITFKTYYNQENFITKLTIKLLDHLSQQ